MKEMMQIFLTAIKKRGHILKLIEKVDELKIKLICEGQEDFLIFQRGEVFLHSDKSVTSYSYEINGQRESIYRLLEGKEKLRILIKDGQLKVKAPFRTILLIESIFYLTKPEELYKEFIS
jgi:hypothetical protein